MIFGILAERIILNILNGRRYSHFTKLIPIRMTFSIYDDIWGAFDSAKNHKRQRHKRQSVTAKREKSQTPKFV